MADLDIIIWGPDMTLCRSDFKAESNPAVFEDAHTTIRYRPTWTVHSDEVDGQILFFIENIQIQTEFYPLLSWIRDLDGMNHQQGHFDLGEIVKNENISLVRDALYGKKFPTRGKNDEQRKQFAKQDSMGVIAKQVAILDEILEQRRKEYDVKTDFGKDNVAQAEFNLLFGKLRL